MVQYRGGRGSHAPLSILPNFSKHVADSLNVFSLALTLDIFLKVDTKVSVCDLNKVSEFQFFESIAFSGVMPTAGQCRPGMRSLWLIMTSFISFGTVANPLIGGTFSHAEMETTNIDRHFLIKVKTVLLKMKILL